MEIENTRMEDKDQLYKNNDPYRRNKTSNRAKIAFGISVLTGFLQGCAEKISPQNQEKINQSTPPQVQVESFPETIEDNTPTIATVPTEVGKSFEISSSNYPTNANNFIIDSRSNEVKTNLIKSWAPEDVEKEISLYNAEFIRMGIDLNNIEYKVSIVDGKSWTLYPENKKTHTSYIVAINEIVRPSIDLFGYLDKKENDDFFDLIPVKINNAEVVGDKSGWHVFAEINNGQITKWYDAVHDQINTIDIEPISTPETSYIINSDFPVISLPELSRNYETIASKFSTISWEDITSGKLFEYEEQNIQKDKLFSDEVVQVPIFKNGRQNIGSRGNIDQLFVDFLGTSMAKNYPETRNIKVVSYYQLKDDELFSKFGIDPIEDPKGWTYIRGDNDPKWPIWLITYAYQNPSGSVSLIHSVGDIYSITDYKYIYKEGLYDTPKGVLELKPGFSYDYTNIKRTEDNIKKENDFLTYFIYQHYPEYKPDESLIDEWVTSNEISDSLQTDIFGFIASLTW